MSVTTIKPSYQPPTALTVTAINSLADVSAAKLAYVDNGNDLALDVAIEFSIVLAAGALAGDQKINVYAYGGTRDGVYSGNIDGAAGAFTLENPNDFQVLAYRSVAGALVGAGGTAKGYIPSLAAYFNGILPERWGLIIENRTGVAFASSGHSVKYQIFQAQGLA
jgi:hypothetical protein